MGDKRFALLIGINYKNQKGQLGGCINDVMDMKILLKKKFKYKESNIIVLSDNLILPTKENILKNLSKLVVNAVKGKVKSIFFHYSGHGSQIKDKNNDENDGKDEVLCPLDYSKKGFITDDKLNSIIKLLPSNASFFGIFDCCHAGTMLDLKYNHVHGDKRTVIEKNAFKIESNVIAISGCKDNQFSADAYIKKRFNGAMTRAFLESLKKRNYIATYFDILNDMRNYLKENKYSQKPQLTCSLKIDENDYFCKPNKKTLFVTY